MMKEEEGVLAQIEKALLRIVMHEGRPEIVFAELDTGGSAMPEEGIIPYLNLIGSNVLGGKGFDEAIQLAIEEDEFGYIEDALDPVGWDNFEIRLPPLYPEWPENIEEGNKRVVASLEAAVQSHEEKFERVKRLYFHVVDNLSFVKIIDRPV